MELEVDVPADKTVVLRRVSQYVAVDPPAACLDALRSTMLAVAPLPRGARAMLTVPVPLYGVPEHLTGPRQFFWAGLEPAVRAVLEGEGYAIQSEGPAPEPLPPPDFEALGRLGLHDAPLLEAVRHHERALVRYSRAAGVDPANLVAEVALAWPDRTLVVAAKRVDEVRRLSHRLQQLMPGVTALSGDDHPSSFGRVVVATHSYHGSWDLEPTRRHLFVALDAREMVGQEGWDSPKFHADARLYGLMDTATRPAPVERDRLASLFGFNEVLVPAHGYRLRPVVRLERSAHGAGPIPGSADAVTVKRTALWQDRARHRSLARLIGRVLAGRVAFDAAASSVLTGTETSRVAVVVEGVEHAVALGRCLPGWPVLAGTHVWRRGLSGPRPVSRAARGPSRLLPANAIVTFEGLAGLDLAGVDVLVRADGGPGLPPLGPLALVQPNHEPQRPLLLLDLTDRGHPLLRAWVRQRRAAYAGQGWHPPGVDATAERVRAFLADRPGPGPTTVLAFPGNEKESPPRERRGREVR